MKNRLMNFPLISFKGLKLRFLVLAFEKVSTAPKNQNPKYHFFILNLGSRKHFLHNQLLENLVFELLIFEKKHSFTRRSDEQSGF